MTRSQFAAYRKLYHELYPPIAREEYALRGSSPHNIAIFVDAEASVCLENIANSHDDNNGDADNTPLSSPRSPVLNVTFKELKARQGALFEAIMTRSATHRDVLVVHSVQAAEPFWVFRRLEEICAGRASLPSVSLVRQFNVDAHANNKQLRPWLLPSKSVVYSSPLEVALAFEDLIKGAWDEDWFDGSGMLRSVGALNEKRIVKIGGVREAEAVSKLAPSKIPQRCPSPVYVHVGFWNKAWRTNQVMRVLFRHLSRGQNVVFFTPHTAGKPDPFDNFALVKWLESLTENRVDEENDGLNQGGTKRSFSESSSSSNAEALGEDNYKQPRLK